MKQKPLEIVFPLLLLTLFWMLERSPRPAVAERGSESERKLRAVAEAVLQDTLFCVVDLDNGRRYPSPEEAPGNSHLRLGSPYNDWRYWNGVLNIGMMKLGAVLDEPAYSRFTPRSIAFGFDTYPYFESRYNGQGKWNYPFGQRFILEELDDCGAMGASVIDVYLRSRQDRYRAYIERAAAHIGGKQHRLDDGTLVRSFPRQWTLWADDLYMSVPFLARMGELSGVNAYFDDGARQVINFHKYLFNREVELMYHCWYSDVARPGIAFWGRANGWALMAEVELLDRLPRDHPRRDTLLQLLRRHIAGIVRYQSTSGLWHQLLDRDSSYLETSCSAMFTYAMARAIRKGYISPEFTAAAHRGWDGVMTRIRSDGKIEGICAGTGVSDDISYYYQRPTPLNDVHGTGAVLLAGAEVLRLGK
jgi:unsaturated rhamnogalacturonyl hydrolase